MIETSDSNDKITIIVTSLKEICKKFARNLQKTCKKFARNLQEISLKELNEKETVHHCINPRTSEDMDRTLKLPNT